MRWLLISTVLLTGCIDLTRNKQLDQGSFTVMTDCEGNRVEVELDLDRTHKGQKAGTK